MLRKHVLLWRILILASVQKKIIKIDTFKNYLIFLLKSSVLLLLMTIEKSNILKNQFK